MELEEVELKAELGAELEVKLEVELEVELKELESEDLCSCLIGIGLSSSDPLWFNKDEIFTMVNSCQVKKKGLTIKTANLLTIEDLSKITLKKGNLREKRVTKRKKKE